MVRLRYRPGVLYSAGRTGGAVDHCWLLREAPTASSGGGTVGAELSGGHLLTCWLETFLDSCAVQPTRASEAWVRRVSFQTRRR